MAFQVPCECGKSVSATEGMAGSAVECGCGRTVRVPSLRLLRGQGLVESPPDVRLPRSTSPVRAVLYGFVVVVFGSLAVCGGLGSVATGDLAAFGSAVALLGQVWLLVLIVRECSPTAIALAFLVPFFTWYFAFQRWDVARWPFLLSVGGILLALAGGLARV